MEDNRLCVLCVDDEENILNSLKRLLRNENYRLLTASNGPEGLRILRENQVHVIISDQRMAEMSGIEFLACVKEEYPDTIRIILTGYTEVDTITEAINKGQIYKFFLKPWNDQNLKLEIRQALDRYQLVQDNQRLHEKVLKQNAELKAINENLEKIVQERTIQLEIQNQALELSRAILEDLPLPIIGVSAEMLVALINGQTQAISLENGGIELGGNLSDYFSEDVENAICDVLGDNTARTIKDYPFCGQTYAIDLIPLSGRYCGKGVVMALQQNQN